MPTNYFPDDGLRKKIDKIDGKVFRFEIAELSLRRSADFFSIFDRLFELFF